MLALRLDAQEQRAYEIGLSIGKGILARIEAQESVANELGNRVLGAINSRLAARGDHASRVAGKIQKNVTKQLGQNYTYAFPLGVIFPTNEQALYGLTSGDLYGSMSVPHLDPAGTGTMVGGAGNDGTFNGGPVGSIGGPPPPVGTIPPPPPATLPGGSGGFGTVPPPLPIPFPCPTGGALGQVGGVCCPPGFHVDPTSGLCSRDPIDCPPGSTYDPTTGQCWYPDSTIVSSAGNDPTCPPGMIPNPNAGGGGGTGGGGTGGGTQDWCPTGFQWNPQYGLCVSTDPAFGGGNGGGIVGHIVQELPPPPACDFSVSFGWTPTADIALIHSVMGVVVGSPWAKPSNYNNGWQAQFAVFDGCYLNPAYDGQAGVWIPSDAQLYAANGIALVWARSQPPGNYQPVPSSAHAAGDGRKTLLTPAGGPLPIAGGGNDPACIPDPGAQACADPPAVPCAPPKLGDLPAMPKGKDSFCSVVDDILKVYRDQHVEIASWIGMATGQLETGPISRAIARALTGQAQPVIPTIISRFAKWLQGIEEKFAKGLNCDPVLMTPVIVVEALVGLLDKWTGAVPDQLTDTIKQISRTICHVILPQVGEADHTWLADTCTDAEWECWVKAAGHRITEATQVRDGKRTRPTYLEALHLLRRKQISQERYDKLKRAAGIIKDEDETDLKTVHRFFPTALELQKLAEEWVFNADTVKRFNLDDEFEAAWSDTWKDKAEAAGLDSEWARLWWRGHWRRPSVTELFEMQARLRPGEAPAGAEFKPEDLDAALRQEGWNDYWRKRLKAISYRVAQRRDVQRLWDYHIIDEKGMKGLLQDQRYEEKFAEQLVESWKIQRMQTENRYNGVPMPAGAIRDFAQGLISTQELVNLLQRSVYYKGQLDEMLGNAEAARTMQVRKLTVQGLKREYAVGLVSLSQARSTLAGLGMDLEEIEELTSYWVRRRNAKPKMVPAGTLCQWRTDGLIDAAQQFTALLELGYARDAATLIVKDCTIKIERAMQKAEDARLAKAEKAAVAAQKAADRLARNPKVKVRFTSQPPAAQTNGTGGGH